jgi:hypothetical protein
MVGGAKISYAARQGGKAIPPRLPQTRAQHGPPAGAPARHLWQNCGKVMSGDWASAQRTKGEVLVGRRL